MTDELEIRVAEPGDAESLVACFARCYRGTYAWDTFDDAAYLAARIAEGSLHSIVAIERRRGVVGHMALTPRPAGALACEAGNTVVDPDFRGHHLAARLGVALSRRCLELGQVGFHHYPTSAHPVMQKLAVAGGGIEEGVLFDYIPADTHYVGFDRSANGARLAVVAVYQPLATAPARAVHVPERYRAVASRIYRRCGLDRTLEPAAAALAPEPSELSAESDERRGLLRLSVERPGSDLCERVARATGNHASVPTLLDLSLEHPSCGAAADALARFGFFFAALLPEYAPGGDVLCLQRAAGRPDPRSLVTPGASELLAECLDDRRKSLDLAADPLG